ncbi:hypothetical protein TanjilG_13095 [Lupinus angustifolius]|uniref:Pollen Ole e 1 allergen and extensin family protein n=1 Tax=Lupinus angustifolius TaxID=3871 RepID=A0A1J7G6L9_LUPAN|nr:hypothetical protein TanjilG_13095 [Lupinus angustifolius]
MENLGMGFEIIAGAVVKLECNNTKKTMIQTATTDRNGKFLIEAHKNVSTYGAHKCKVFLFSAPHGLKRSNIHGGIKGATLRSEAHDLLGNPKYHLYTVLDLAFEPICPH